MWGHPVPVLGAISPFLEPFRGRLSPNIDNVSEKLTLRYPHEGPWVADLRLEYSLCPQGERQANADPRYGTVGSYAGYRVLRQAEA